MGTDFVLEITHMEKYPDFDKLAELRTWHCLDGR